MDIKLTKNVKRIIKNINKHRTLKNIIFCMSQLSISKLYHEIL